MFEIQCPIAASASHTPQTIKPKTTKTSSINNFSFLVKIERLISQF